MNTKNKSLIEIHFAVLLFGLSGLFGKLIELPSLIIVLGRVFFSSIFLVTILLISKKNIKLKQRKDYFYLIIMGVILAIHWSAFYKSIQVSTVAIGLLTFSTFPVFVTFLEPYFFKERLSLKDVFAAVVAFIGIVLVIPKFELGNTITQGVIWGIFSGFTYAILSMLNKKCVQDYSGSVICFYEQLIATIVLLPFYFVVKPIFNTKDILLLILLGVIFTATAHSLFISGLKNVKTQTAGIISSLEPVYGIIFAVFFLNEIPNFREILGGILILVTVIYSTIKSS